MNVIINGSINSINTNITVIDLLQQLGLQNQKIAVELNEEIISRSEYPKKIIFENDKIEIIQAIGGG